MMEFDDDENLEKASDVPIGIGCLKVEDIKPEVYETEQLILPDGIPANNQAGGNDSDEMILPDCDETSKLTDDPVKHEPLDIEPEMDEFKKEHHELMVDNDSATDSQDETLPSDVQHRASTRKGVGEPLWLKSVVELRRERKIRGLSYTSSTGSIIPARAVKPNCGAGCKLQCFTRVPEELRHQLLANLLQLSQSDQRKFLSDHICNMPAARPRSIAGRIYNHYFLPAESRLVKVCKTMFKNTYDLPQKTLDKVISKKIGDKHVVCGNPNFPALLKKGSKIYFDYDEGCGEAVAEPPEVWEEGCKCELHCGHVIPAEVVERIRSSFRNKSRMEQNNFLLKLVQLRTNKRKRRKNALSLVQFYLPLGSNVEEVCKMMFQHVFKLNSSQVRTLLKNMSKIPELPVEEVMDPVQFAKEHIAAHRMDEDHHCVVSGALVKLSHSPNVARMYSEYQEGCQQGVEPIGYRQYYAEFNNNFVRTGLLLPAKCPDCGFFNRGEGG